MVSKWQSLLSVFAFSLLCGNFCVASWWNPMRSATIDRSMPATNDTRDFHILPVDRTTFSISKGVWLQQIDMSKIFISNASRNVNVPNNVSVKVKIVQMHLNDRRFKAAVYIGNVTLSSINETKIVFQSDILLQSGNMYEIQLFMPALNFIYSENLSVKPYKIRRLTFWRSIVMSFFPANVVDSSTPIENISKMKISVGLVKRIHLKYTVL